jgi:hypothetical protein
LLTTRPHEPVGQHATLEISPHLFLDVKGQVVLGGPGLLEKGLPIPSQDLVEGFLFGLTPTVGWCPDV